MSLGALFETRQVAEDHKREEKIAGIGRVSDKMSKNSRKVYETRKKTYSLSGLNCSMPKDYLLFIFTLLVSVALFHAFPGHRVGVISTLIKRNEQMCAKVPVLRMDAILLQLLHRNLHNYRIRKRSK